MHEGHWHLVFPYMHETLYSRMTTRVITLEQVRGIMMGILSGVAYMHEKGFLHRDLKPQNILVSSDLSKIKVADLGMARDYTGDVLLTPKHCTPNYRPPEIFLGSKTYGHGVDVWSCGVIMAELLIDPDRRPLFHGSSDFDMYMKICELLGAPTTQSWPEIKDLPLFSPALPSPAGSSLTFLARHGPRVKEPVMAMLQMNPRERPEAKRVLQMEFFH